MSEQGAPKPEKPEKQDKAAKKGGGGDGAAKAEGGKKAAAPEVGGKKEKGGGKQPAGPKAGKEARDPNYVPRFKKRYFDVVRPELMKKFGLQIASVQQPGQPAGTTAATASTKFKPVVATPSQVKAASDQLMAQYKALLTRGIRR